MKKKNFKLLLIEDNPGDARLIYEMTRQTGMTSFELDYADCLAEGIKRLRDGSFDAVLLDLSLPDCQGLETFSRLKATAPEVPIILLTGTNDETLAVKAVRQGAQDYLVKGQVDRQLLGRSIRYAIERKHSEEKLVEHYQEEKELRRQLEDEIKKRAEFMRALVHELKTPLTPVLASSDLLVDGLTDEPWNSIARNINRGASTLNDRIEELLDIARGELGMLQFNLKPIDPLAVLAEAAETMASVATSREQSLTLELPSSLPMIRGDESRLRQVLLNLLGNASKYTPAKGRLALRATQRNDSLVVEVEDNGPGIAEADRKRLFEPYYRVEADRQHFKGLGLGLALCKRLVELHHGQIWVKSEQYRGSTFGFSIPCG